MRSEATTTDPDVPVIDRRLPGRIGALWDPVSRVIWVDPRLTARARASSLAHEREHARRDDRPCATPWHTRRQESAVERAAARRAISLEALAEALAWACCEDELADALGYDPALVRARIAALAADEVKAIEDRIERIGRTA